MTDSEDDDVPQAPPTTPLAYLASLAANGEISAAERDAGEILHAIGRHAISAAPTAQQVSYKWRYATGAWSFMFEPKRLVIEKYEDALATAGTDGRRRALVSCLVSRTPATDDTGMLAGGLSAIARHWWGAPAGVTVKRGAVTMPAVRTIDYDTPAANDNNPTPERVAQNTAQRDNFERLLVRGQIDEDPEVAAALYAAGLRYETDHQLAYSGLYGSPDYAKPLVDGSSAPATPITERAEQARARLKVARAAMGARYAEVVDAVVVQGVTLEAAGRRYTGYRGTDTSAAAAKERLNAGLRALAILYGIAVRRKAA